MRAGPDQSSTGLCVCGRGGVLASQKNVRKRNEKNERQGKAEVDREKEKEACIQYVCFSLPLNLLLNKKTG